MPSTPTPPTVLSIAARPNNRKVTHNAQHLLLTQEREKTARAGKPAFSSDHCQLITPQGPQVDLKFDFDQINRGLDGKEAGKVIPGEGQKDKDC